MVEAVSNKTVSKQLNELIEMDFDAIAAYQAAVERLESEGLKTQLLQFMRDHEQHVARLSAAVKELGGMPVKKGDIKRLLTKGSVFIADLFGDKAILMAMRVNEEHTNKAYEAAVKERFPEDIHRIVLGGLSDERHHRDWIVAKIKAME